ncbi:uncharacterized protein isoform X2 [Salmo salar]|uniref:Uncharacterized protein isoform X2 n=1 Tax=Salmo salar TaxID=8030 RepID=A0ABM3DQS1_SALSA|nr:uncharacterized protein LOC106583724 isoform X2 [Salmo salar]
MIEDNESSTMKILDIDDDMYVKPRTRHGFQYSVHFQWWKRSFGVPALCLGLLCILLLAGIIGMGISFTGQHYCDESDQLQTSNNNLIKVRDRLPSSCSTLAKERDQLPSSCSTLANERDQLQTSYNNLTKVIDQLQTSNNNLAKEIDQLQTSYNNLTKVIDQLQTSNNILTKERDHHQREREKLKVKGNLALNGVATQSSLYNNRDASDAIDGKRNTNYGSCTHTLKDRNPWWRVDLLNVYRITDVTLTNRGDCCPERLDGAEIRIGNSLENNGINNPRCAVISHIPAGEAHTFQCNEMEGRYVVVVIPGRSEWLTLCELEVHGTPAGNLALNGVATQSSLYNNRNASDAIDGKRNTNYGSCTHTLKDRNPWWRVDLLNVYRITDVTLTNRGDCCPERLDGAEIRIGNSLENNGINNPRCAVISHIPAGEAHTFQCNEMEGRYVVVVIPGRSEWLTLCELEVHGTPAGRPCPEGWKTSVSSCYYTTTMIKTWEESRKDCNERGAHLVIINSREEQTFINGLYGPGNETWIGLTNVDTEGTWKWVDGTPLTTAYWKTGKPSSYLGANQDCVEFFHRSSDLGEWNDEECHKPNNWICEIF